MSSAARLVARRLEEAGCRFAFGIPGGETLTLMEALAAAGLRFVLTRHETAAGFMAEGVHHAAAISGSMVPGVLVTTVGPGLANAVNVVANAEQDRVPLIVLSGCVEAAEAATYTHQVFDHQQLLRPITKASFRLAPGAVDAIVDKAVAIALDPPMGPVHIDVPIALAASEEPERAPVRRVRPAPVAPAPGPALDRARGWLAEAGRPLLIAGVDALMHGAEATVSGFARANRVPVVTTYKAKGILDEDDPLALGGAGLSPVADRHLLPLVAEADCVILAGYDPIEMRVGWRDPWAAGARVIELAAQANRHYMHQAGISFVGDVGAGLRAVADGVEPRGRWPADRLEATRRALRDAFAADEDWGPAAIVDEARAVLPPETVATVDSGAHRILLSQVWRAPAPRTLLQSSALCTMGCALPLAIGAKAAAPDRPVVAFTGDAGLEMCLGELATLRDLGLPVIVVVFVDASLALIELKQRTSQMGNLGVDFAETDFAALAAALGGTGHRVDSRAGLRAALESALAADAFSLIAARIPRRAYDGRI